MSRRNRHHRSWSGGGAWLCAVALACTASLEAQERPTTTNYQARGVEITPFLSLGSESSSRLGAAIQFPVARNLTIEHEIGYRRGEVHALSSHVSALYDLPRVGRVTPYLAAGIGLEQHGSPLQSSAGAVLAQRRIALAVNAGGGITLDATRHWAVRTDARWFNGIGRDAPEHWRVYNGVTFRAGAK